MNHMAKFKHRNFRATFDIQSKGKFKINFKMLFYSVDGKSIECSSGSYFKCDFVNFKGNILETLQTFQVK